MVNTLKTKKKEKHGNKSQLRSNIFYAALMLFPVIQFILFYVVVNFRSFGYAFMHREMINDTQVKWVVSFKNISEWFTNSSKFRDLCETAKASLIYYGVTLLVSIPMGLLFAYYFLKKMPGAKAFRVFLFLPSIIPVAAFALTFKNILNIVLPPLLHQEQGVFDQNQFFWILFYNLYISFGTSVLMYANKMFEISPEIIEAGKLDGATGIKEFWHIVLPLTFPTLSVFLITGVATMFTNQYNLPLFNADPECRSLGFFLYTETAPTNRYPQKIPSVAALGFIMTVVAIPLTFLVRYLLEKFGPKEE